MPVRDVHGATIAYEDAGSGDAVLLLHGAMPGRSRLGRSAAPQPACDGLPRQVSCLPAPARALENPSRLTHVGDALRLETWKKLLRR